MGLIGRLLTLPVAGPVKGLAWIAEQVREAAEAELYDEGRILAELNDLARQHDAGMLSDEEHEAAEDALLERLVVARARAASRGARQ
jgi:hypothetical protein